MSADLESIEADLDNQEMTWMGNTYPVIPAGAGALLELEEGGFGSVIDLILKVRTNLFTDGIYPLSQQKIVVDNKNYRIDSVNKDPFGVMLKLNLVDDTRGI